VRREKSAAPSALASSFFASRGSVRDAKNEEVKKAVSRST